MTKEILAKMDSYESETDMNNSSTKGYNKSSNYSDYYLHQIKTEINTPEDTAVIKRTKKLMGIDKKTNTLGRKRKFPEQNRFIRKFKANTNQAYINEKGEEVAPKVFLGYSFDCKCSKECTKRIPAEIREAEFNSFWSAGAYEARCAILQENVKETAKKRCYSAKSTRVFTRTYSINNNSVCKKTFLNTYGISQSRVDSALLKFRSHDILDRRGVQPSTYKTLELNEFIAKVPIYSSHFHASSSFLAPEMTLDRLYELYKSKNADGVSLWKFKKSLQNEYNLKFVESYETCKYCENFETQIKGSSKNQLELQEQHINHLNNAFSLQHQMKTDLNRAKADSFVETLTFDLGKTHNLPKLPIKEAPFKRNLNLYNLGLHSGSNGNYYFYLWLEHEAGRGPQEIASCLRKIIECNLKRTTKHLILWTHSSYGQNRNMKLILHLMHTLQNHSKLIKITLRYLEPGHIYLPTNKIFADIESTIKSNTWICTDEDYIRIFKYSKMKSKFKCHKLNAEDVFSIKPLEDQIILNGSANVSFHNIHEIELLKNNPNTIYMKSNLTDKTIEFDIGGSLKLDFDCELPLLWPEGRKLSNAKVNDLKDLISSLPSGVMPFYDFLGRVRTSDFVDDIDGFGEELDFTLEDYLFDI